MAGEVELDRLVVRLMGDGSDYEQMMDAAQEQAQRTVTTMEGSTAGTNDFSGALQNLNDQEQAVTAGGNSMNRAHRSVGHGLVLAGQAVSKFDAGLGASVITMGAAIRYASMGERAYLGLERSIKAAAKSQIVLTAASYGVTLPVLAIGAAAVAAAYGIYRLAQATNFAKEIDEDYSKSLDATRSHLDRQRGLEPFLPRFHPVESTTSEDITAAKNAKRRGEEELESLAAVAHEKEKILLQEKKKRDRFLERNPEAGGVTPYQEELRKAEGAYLKAKAGENEVADKVKKAKGALIALLNKEADAVLAAALAGKKYREGLDTEVGLLDERNKLLKEAESDAKSAKSAAMNVGNRPGHEMEDALKNKYAMDPSDDPKVQQTREKALADSSVADSARVAHSHDLVMRGLKSQVDALKQGTPAWAAWSAAYDAATAAGREEFAAREANAAYDNSVLQSRKKIDEELKSGKIAEENMAGAIAAARDPRNEQLQQMIAVESAMRLWNNANRDAAVAQREAKRGELERAEAQKFLLKHVQEGAAAQEKYMEPLDRMIRDHLNKLMREGAFGEGAKGAKVYEKALKDAYAQAHKDYVAQFKSTGMDALLTNTHAWARAKYEFEIGKSVIPLEGGGAGNAAPSVTGKERQKFKRESAALSRKMNEVDNRGVAPMDQFEFHGSQPETGSRESGEDYGVKEVIDPTTAGLLKELVAVTQKMESKVSSGSLATADF